MFPWAFCRTKSLKSREGVSPWKEFFHARLSKSKHPWNCDINEEHGRGVTLVAGVTSGRV